MWQSVRPETMRRPRSLQRRGHGLRVFQHLLLIGPELGLERLAEGHRLRGDHVHQRPALQPREDRRVERASRAPARPKIMPPRGPRSVLCVVRGDEVGDADRRRIEAGGDQAGVVRDVGHQQRAALVGDVRASASSRWRASRPKRRSTMSFGLCSQREFLGCVVVDLLLRVQAVGDDAVELAARVDRRAVREVAAVRERHAEDRVAGLEDRDVHRLVRLRARVRLHVGLRRAEQLLRALDGERARPCRRTRSRRSSACRDSPRRTCW